MLTPKTLKIILLIYITALIVVTYIPLIGGVKAINYTYMAGFRADYVLHAITFIPWMTVWIIAFPDISSGRLLLVFFSGFLLACGLEFSQHLISWRTYNPIDMVSNIAGLLIGGIPIVILKINKRAGKK